MLTGPENFPDSWGEGEMRTRPLTKMGVSSKVFEGEIDPGEYTNNITVPQEITVLSGAVYFTNSQDGTLQVCRKGQSFKLQAGQTYVFRFREKFAFRCVYQQ